jgi:hypothetical protein
MVVKKQYLLLTLLIALFVGQFAFAQSRVLNLVERDLCLALEPAQTAEQILQSILIRAGDSNDVTLPVDTMGIQENLISSISNVMLVENVSYDTHPNCSDYRSVLILDVYFDTNRSYYVQLSVTDFSRRSYPAPVDLWRRVSYGFAPEGESIEARLIPIAEDMLYEFTATWQAAHPE